MDQDILVQRRRNAKVAINCPINQTGGVKRPASNKDEHKHQRVYSLFGFDKEMNMKVTIGVLSCVLSFAAMTDSVMAETYQPHRLTCEEFIALDSALRLKVVYWAEGFRKTGEPTEHFIDVAEIDRLVLMLVAECKETPNITLSKKIDEYPVTFNKSAMTQKSAAIHKPANMTCEEFVALDDVDKPKVLYWSTGVNKHGDLTNSIVDINETDSLVPVLVTKCRKTPKLSFWEKIKQYF